MLIPALLGSGGSASPVATYSAASNDATLDITNLDFSEPDIEWEFKIVAAQAKTASAFRMRVDVGSGFESGANYTTSRVGHTSANSATNDGSNTATSIKLLGGVSSTVISPGGSVFANSLEKTDRHKYFVCAATAQATNNVSGVAGGAYDGGTGAIVGVQFFFETGNIEVLEVSVFKRRLS